MEARTIADAFVYLLSRALVVRQEHLDRKKEGFAYNRIRYRPAGPADLLSPGFDVACLEGWIAADDARPAILETSEVRGLRHTAHILDEWGELIASISERMYRSRPFGKFALCKPGSAVRLRSDTERIDLHSAKARLLGRVELTDDAGGPAALQTIFMLTAQGKPGITPPPDIPMFPDDKLIGAELFDLADVLMGSARDVSPCAADMQQKVRAAAGHTNSRLRARQDVEGLLRETVIPEFRQFAFARAACVPAPGEYNGDYWQRAAANYAGMRAGMTGEVITVAMQDASGSMPAKAI